MVRVISVAIETRLLVGLLLRWSLLLLLLVLLRNQLIGGVDVGRAVSGGRGWTWMIARVTSGSVIVPLIGVLLAGERNLARLVGVSVGRLLISLMMRICSPVASATVSTVGAVITSCLGSCHSTRCVQVYLR